MSMITLLRKRRIRMLKEAFFAEINNLQQAYRHHEDSQDMDKRVERIKRLCVKLCKYIK